MASNNGADVSAINTLLAVVNKTEILTGIEKAMEGNVTASHIRADETMKKYHQGASILMFKNLIKKQAASKLALEPLTFISPDTMDAVKLAIWEDDHDFLLKRFSLEESMIDEPIKWLGFHLVDEGDHQEPFPFTARITELLLHPITDKILNLSFVVSEAEKAGTTNNIVERWSWQDDKAAYHVTRSYAKANKSTPGPIKKLEDAFDKDQYEENLQGSLFLNTLDKQSDIQNVIHLMKDRGEMMYWLLKKFKTLSPKVFDKAQIYSGNAQETEKELEEATLIRLSQRAAQYQTPLTVFNPTLPNSVIIDTIKFYDDVIFMGSLASRPSDSGKQAQSSLLEMSIKNEQANNYVEYKKNIRQSQFTKYVNLIAPYLGIKNQIKVQVELSSTQKRLLDPTEDKGGDNA